MFLADGIFPLLRRGAVPLGLRRAQIAPERASSQEAEISQPISEHQSPQHITALGETGLIGRNPASGTNHYAEIRTTALQTAQGLQRLPTSVFIASRASRW